MSFKSTEFFLDTTFNFNNVVEAINDNVTVTAPGGGITIDNGSINNGAPLVDGGGFFIGVDSDYTKFMLGDFNHDYIFYSEEDDGDIIGRLSSLELQGALLGPAEFIIDPHPHTDDAGNLVIRGDVTIGQTAGLITLGVDGTATIKHLSVMNETNEVAYINSDGSIWGKQLSTDGATISEAGAAIITSLDVNSVASIDALGLLKSTGINIGNGNFTVDTAGGVTAADSLSVADTVVANNTGLTVGASHFDSEGNLYVGPEGTGLFFGIDGQFDLNVELGELDGVTISSPATGHVLRYNGINWENSTLPFSEIGSKPTTISGYGITDAFDGAYSSLTGAPTNISYFTNNANYTIAGSNVSQFVNDAGYLTSAAYTPAIANSSGVPVLTSGITAAEVRTAIGAGTSSFSGSYNDLTNLPTGFAPLSHTHPWSQITSTPTTIQGYGITDAFSGSYNDLTDIPAPAAYYLDDLLDVSTSLATEGDVLVRNSSGTYSFQNRPLAYGVERQYYTATEGQTTFDILYGAAGKVLVVVNGIVLDDSNYAATSLTDITLNEGLVAGDQVTLVGYVERDEMEVVEVLNDLADVSTAGAQAGHALLKMSTGGYQFWQYDWDNLANKPVFHGVATSGDYNDLENLPSLATVATTGSYTDLLNKPALSAVATSGSYNDLLNRPYIPTSLGNLSDVTLGTRLTGQTLIYDQTSSQWENQYLTLGGLNNVGDWADAPEDGDPVYLRWSSVDELWVPYQVEIDDIYGIPEPTSSQSNYVLSVSTTAQPQTYKWTDPATLPGVAATEEGTWTARFYDDYGNYSYTTATGYYYKVGKLVHVTLRVFNIDHQPYINTSRYFRITGLPYAIATDAFGPVLANHIENIGQDYTDGLIVGGLAGWSELRAWYNRYSSTTAGLLWSAINDDDSDMYISLTYRTT